MQLDKRVIDAPYFVFPLLCYAERIAREETGIGQKWLFSRLFQNF
jgi:hypothetical protein